MECFARGFGCIALHFECVVVFHAHCFPSNPLGHINTQFRITFAVTQLATDDSSIWQGIMVATDNSIDREGIRVKCVLGKTMWSRLGSIHTKDARFFCCANSAADISKSHTFKWDPLADEVLEAAWSSPTEKTSSANGPHLNVWGFDISAAEFPQQTKTRVFGVNRPLRVRYL